MAITNYMKLTKWTDPTNDKFNYLELATNFDLIDSHNHASGYGVQIPTGGIQDGAITSDKIASNTIQSTDIANNAIGSSQIQDNAITANKLDFSSINTITTSLSGTNYTDGDIINYKPSGANYVWQLRFTVVDSSKYWYFVGGGPIFARSNASVQVDTAGYVESGNCSVAVPAGSYHVNFGGTMNLYFGSIQTTALGYIGVGTSNSNIISDVVLSAPRIEETTGGFSQTNMGMSLSRSTVYTNTAASSTLKIYARAEETGLSNNGNTSVGRYFIFVTPIYLTVL